MTWTADSWDAFCGLISEAWPGTFDDDAAASWRVLLDDVEPDQAVAAMRRLLVGGQTFRPSVAELMGELRADPSKPTFDEMFVIVFGPPRGALNARASVPAGGWPHDSDRLRAQEEAVVEALGLHHALIGRFVLQQGIHRLRTMPLFDPQYGELRRKELRDAWDVFVDAFDGREVAAIAAGTGTEGLKQLDPLSSLGLEPPAAQLTTGGEA